MKKGSDKNEPTASAEMRARSGEWTDVPVRDEKRHMQEPSDDLRHTDLNHFQEINRYKVRENMLTGLMGKQRKLTAHLMAVQEEERAAVAREIQEDLGQMLAALHLHVSLMSIEYRDHAQIIARTNVMEKLITSSIVSVQRISSELRPVMLDILGLADAIEWKIQKFQQKTGIPCKSVVLLGEMKVSSAVSTALFRIFQEALTNVIQHPGATLVKVSLVVKNGWLILSVRDNGREIVEKEKKDLLALSVAGIRGRAEALGGKLKVFVSPRHGNVLLARICINREGGLTCPPG